MVETLRIDIPWLHVILKMEALEAYIYIHVQGPPAKLQQIAKNAISYEPVNPQIRD